MLLKDQYIHNKSILICLLGNPNVGKSSLINCLLGFDLSPVTSKPQTTRTRFNCVCTIDHTELVLIDTPGIHSSGKEINIRMTGQATEAALDSGADLNLLLIDLTVNIDKQVEEITRNLQGELQNSWLVFTKKDLIDVEQFDFEKIAEKIKEKIPAIEKHFVISAKDEDGVHLLTGDICDCAQPGRHFYPEGECSNKSERFFVTEYIREQAFELLHEELPYELAVVIDEYCDFRNKKQDYMDMVNEAMGKNEQDTVPDDEYKIVALISASILVNRPSQRGIVVGKAGSVIKEIGTKARKKIEAMVGGKIRLNLHVKVSPNWFKNNYVLQELGLPRVQSSGRVWRRK